MKEDPMLSRKSLILSACFAVLAVGAGCIPDEASSQSVNPEGLYCEKLHPAGIKIAAINKAEGSDDIVSRLRSDGAGATE